MCLFLEYVRYKHVKIRYFHTDKYIAAVRLLDFSVMYYLYSLNVLILPEKEVVLVAGLDMFYFTSVNDFHFLFFLSFLSKSNYIIMF